MAPTLGVMTSVSDMKCHTPRGSRCLRSVQAIRNSHLHVAPSSPMFPSLHSVVSTASMIALRRLRSSQVPRGSDSDWEDWADALHVPSLNPGSDSQGSPSGRTAFSAHDDDGWRGDLSNLSAALRSELTQDQEAALAPSQFPGGEQPRERAFLVSAALKSAQRPGRLGYGVLESLEELSRLADTAGLEVVGHTYQMLDEPNPRTYVGAGKVAEIVVAVEKKGAETIIFDDELSPGQLRNLERALGGSVRLCDRTALILDIFSQRAATREGQLQVELAQVEYQLPRLTRMWTHLERQSGSGRMKGMGEKQIEVDRRLLRDRAARLRREIEEVRTHRKAYRDRRAEAPIPVIALVGYTNAGKSTLLNALTGAGVLAEDRLFATLDPTTRRVSMPGGQEILISDTVGFIQKLPTQLVAAFRATLEEIRDASLLLHVVDASHASAAAQVDAVRAVLKDLEVSNVPTLTVWNKVDACADPEAVAAVAKRREATVCVSAISGDGIDALLAAVGARLQQSMTFIKVLVPYSQGELVEEAHRCGVVHKIKYTAEGCDLEGHVPPGLAARLEKIRTQEVVNDRTKQKKLTATPSNGNGVSVEDDEGWAQVMAELEAAERITRAERTM